MTDIPSLIDDTRLDTAIAAAKEWLEPPHDEANIRHAIGAALEAFRLTVSPPPEEIAKLLNWAHKAITVPMNHADYPGRANLIESLAAALQQQAQRIERMRINIVNCAAKMREESARIAELEAQLNSALNLAQEQGDLKVGLRARIAELEAERDRCRETNQVLMGQWELECLERDAMRAKTIEECASVKVTIPQKAFAVGEAAYLDGFQDGAAAQIEAVRALDQPEADEGESK